MRVAQTWDSIPHVILCDGELVSTRTIERKHREVIVVANALLEYIDAIPKEIEFGVTMPDVDRDWVDKVLRYQV